MSVKIKANISSVFREDMTCRHCPTAETESQEHMGRQIEQPGLEMNTFEGKVIFWRRMAPILKKLDSAHKIKALEAKLARLPDELKSNQNPADKLKAKKKILAEEDKWQ